MPVSVQHTARNRAVSTAGAWHSTRASATEAGVAAGAIKVSAASV